MGIVIGGACEYSLMGYTHNKEIILTLDIMPELFSVQKKAALNG